jgi:hypothetical protein
MRVVGLAVLCLFAAVLSALGSYSYGEPARQTGISFSFPYNCSNERQGTGRHTKKFCLADSLQAGLNVVLVGDKGNCSAKTADTFTDEHAGREFEATHLTGTGNCLTEGNKKGFHVAVVGVDPSVVHVVEPRNDKSPLPEDIELKARKVASSGYQKLEAGRPRKWDVADSPPDVFSVGNVAFLLFQCTDEFLNQDGLPVLVLNDNAFLLEGACASRPPFFFSVKEKLHLAYWATVVCCGCGDSNFFAYDLSGELPTLVYRNSDFSD